jgi:hypothetical protein
MDRLVGSLETGRGVDFGPPRLWLPLCGALVLIYVPAASTMRPDEGVFPVWGMSWEPHEVASWDCCCCC